MALYWLACTLVLSVAGVTECAVTEGFKSIPFNVPSDWGSSPSDADLQGRGFWTKWINTDDSKVGTGDYENVNAILAKQPLADGSCPLFCNNPVGVQWKLADDTHKSDIEQCLVLDTSKFGLNQSPNPGFNCLDAYQNDASKADFCTKEKCIEIGMRKPGSRKRGLTCDQCPDMTVRYLCPTPVPPTTVCPSAPSTRGVAGGVELQLEELDTQIQASAKELSDLQQRASDLEEREMRGLDRENEVDELRSLLMKVLNLEN